MNSNLDFLTRSGAKPYRVDATRESALIQGDCLEVMDEMIEEGIKVDLTVTSPPYDNLRTYKDSLVWNESIWKQVIKRLYDITVEGGVVVWVVGDATIKGSETGTSFKQALYFKECGFNLHDTMIWEKQTFTATGALKTRYAQVFEYMFILTKGKIKTFIPIKDRETKGIRKKHGTVRQKDGSIKPQSNIGKVYDNKQAQRFNVWKINTECSNKNRFHPAQFPEKLVNDHIISWSNEGDTVFDPFMGSGTTGKMALLNNREFIGIEKVDEYFEIAKNRIEKAMEGER
jgi:site-specific DNA-methyltransferase (adenine-specific)